ncbi:FAD-binding oxidoreductase [Paenibacillus doosanensis]|uniref:FAD-binding oxidoreductase n=1 Tax=Paenibacillus doosanensis TaxID=1229154 RepID=UPI00217F86A9|nr:FAD-binding oxidoreductase [Paenibacillus doosanensis]MCS7464003.1 FAD-binding oxidoreductase [Paenibacillus doosanensis]
MNRLFGELIALLGDDRVVLELASREQLSKDFYWYSPILTELLDGKTADVIVYPLNEEEVKRVLSLAVQHEVPVTVRGAGTGNYGQIVPLQGGVLVDVSRMNRILDIGEGYVRVEPGVKISTLEKTLREQRQELCIIPSTYAKSTAAGFVSGGSGGIGSISWGLLWDGNVIEATIITAEAEPRVIRSRGDDLLNYIHSYGTTGVITEVIYRAVPRVEWAQCIASFADLEDSLRFSETLAQDESIPKRSVSTCEWPIPSYFRPLKKVIQDQKHVVILEVDEASLERLQPLLERYNGTITHAIPAANYMKGQGLAEYTWNHTTLWALKADESMTYLQGSFSLDRYMEQIGLIKAKFPDEFYNHFDWMRSGGELIPQQIPLVRFTTKERLYEMIDFCESIGVKIFNPHTYLLEEGGWEAHIQRVIRTKNQNDPKGLLNPGKIGLPLKAPSV